MDLILATTLTVCFVGSIYLWKREREFILTAVENLELAAVTNTIFIDRDDAQTIGRRIISFSVAAFLCWVFLLAGGKQSVLYVEIHSIVKCTIATVILLYYPAKLSGNFESKWREMMCKKFTLQRFRDVLFAPIAEEFFFRGVLYAILYKRSVYWQILTTAMLFAAAHLHNFFVLAAKLFREATLLENNNAEDCDINSIMLWSKREARNTIFLQCACCYVFSIICGVLYVYVSEYNIWCAIVIHIVCNFIGCPQFKFVYDKTINSRQRAFHAAAYFSSILLCMLICTL